MASYWASSAEETIRTKLGLELGKQRRNGPRVGQSCLAAICQKLGKTCFTRRSVDSVLAERKTAPCAPVRGLSTRSCLQNKALGVSLTDLLKQLTKQTRKAKSTKEGLRNKELLCGELASARLGCYLTSLGSRTLPPRDQPLPCLPPPPESPTARLTLPPLAPCPLPPPSPFLAPPPSDFCIRTALSHYRRKSMMLVHGNLLVSF